MIKTICPINKCFSADWYSIVLQNNYRIDYYTQDLKTLTSQDTVMSDASLFSTFVLKLSLWAECSPKNRIRCVVYRTIPCCLPAPFESTHKTSASLHFHTCMTSLACWKHMHHVGCSEHPTRCKCLQTCPCANRIQDPSRTPLLTNYELLSN